MLSHRDTFHCQVKSSPVYICLYLRLSLKLPEALLSSVLILQSGFLTLYIDAIATRGLNRLSDHNTHMNFVQHQVQCCNAVAMFITSSHGDPGNPL